MPPAAASTTTPTRRRSPTPAGAAPLRCFTEPVHLGRPLEAFPFTGRTSRRPPTRPTRPAAAVRAAADRARQSPAWRYREIATNHMIPSNRPDELAALLLELTADAVRRPRRRPRAEVARPAGG